LTDFDLLIARRFLSFKRCAREFAMPEVTLISIVDDDQLARDGIRELIESFGYNAVTFTSAEHFLQSGVIAHTTCMIIDVQMPGQNALSCRKRCERRDTARRQFSLPPTQMRTIGNVRSMAEQSAS
jgi:FixJ family two-component response regulator